ncbi:MAG: DUF1565 domain-containing protein, partial [Xenococcaceae cyanobacterium]
MNYLLLPLTSLIIIGTLPLTLTKSVLAQSNFNATENRDRSIPKDENTIYVDPKSGDDRAGEGSERSPLKTITQALMLAKPKTIIQLAPGTYSKETGESFPITVRSDVTLKGSPSGQGYNTIIRGSGYFISPTAAGQHVSVVAMRDAAEITGVTIINPENRGYGLWIESASPKVVANTFTRNGNTGLSVNGKSAPLIASNSFYNNMGNGLSVYDTAKPEIRDNVFEKTGFAVSIAENAEPILTSNRFSGNRIGTIVQGNSRAILRNNSIENSSESGVVAIANAKVDLGSDREPGGNIFRNNAKVDIQNVGKGQIIAFGNQVSGRTEGKIDLSGNKIALNSANTSTSKLPPLPIRKSTVSSENFLDRIANIPKQSPLSPLPANSLHLSSPKAENELVFSAPGNQLPANRLSDRPLPPRSSTASNSSANSDRAIETDTEILPPPPPIKDPGAEKDFNNENGRGAGVQGSQGEINLMQSVNSDRLPVPNSLMSSLPTNSSVANSSKTTRYRVMAIADNSDRQDKVRSLYPEAFTTVF